jgi:hypothetical protein
MLKRAMSSCPAALERASRLDVHDVESLRLAVASTVTEKFEKPAATNARHRTATDRRANTPCSKFQKNGRNDEANAVLAKVRAECMVLGPSAAN